MSVQSKSGRGPPAVTPTKNPAVAVGGDAAGVENPGDKGPEGDSDMAGDNKPGQQEQE